MAADDVYLAPLRDRTAVMSGGSRGIGLAIAVALGRAGCNVVLLAKTDQPHPKLEGTIHTAVDAITQAGGRAIGVVGDVRDETDVRRCINAAVDAFSGIDLVINNASAIALQPIGQLPSARFDLMIDVNLRGTFTLTQAALPHVRQSQHGHVLTISPPLLRDNRWLSEHAPYTLTKMGMTMLTLGLAEDERTQEIAANCLWPRTFIATEAVRNLLGGKGQISRARRPEIMAAAAVAVLRRRPAEFSGHTLIDDEVLRAEGPVDLEQYAVEPDGELALDLFVDEWLDEVPH